MGTMTTTKKAPAKPADHKAKASDTLDLSVRGVDVSVPRDALDDFELLDDLGRLDEGDATRLPGVLRRLAGDKYRALLDTARDDDTGKVSVEAGAALVSEVLEALDPNS